MNRQLKYAALTMVVALGLTVGLAGCGSETTATTANVTFRTDPPSEVWLAGESKGMTPIVLALDAGEHTITFKAAGFKDASGPVTVNGGKPITVETALVVDGTDEEAVARVAKLLAEVEREPFEKPKAHRGAGDKPVMPYWPAKNVRKEGLTTYRIDVTEEYEGDGFIEFRKGRKVLHREKFEPDSFATVKSVPESVREAVKIGSSITWGVYFKNKRKKAITSKFKVVSSTRFNKRMAKLEHRKYFQRQPAIVQGGLRNGIYQSSKLYSEGLIHSLDLANRNPRSTMPFKDIVTNARRLGLKDTPLFLEASQYVSGRGGRGRSNAGVGGGGVSDLPGASGQIGALPGGSSLPEVFANPSPGGAIAAPTAGTSGSVRNTMGTGSKAMGPGGAGTTAERNTTSGRMQRAGDQGISREGFSVRATPKDQQRKSGDKPDEPTEDAQKAEAAARDAALNDMAQQLSDAEQRESLAQDAEQRMADAESKSQQAQQDLSDAQSELQTANQNLQNNPGDAQAAQDVQDAQQKVNDASAAADQAAAARDQTAQRTRETLEQTGSAAEARADAERIKADMQQLRSEGPVTAGGTTPPGTVAAGGNNPQDAQRMANIAQTERNQANDALNQARSDLAAAEGAAGANPTASEIKAVEDAHAAVREAQERVDNAESALQQAGGVTAGQPDTRRDTRMNAENALNQAREGLAAAEQAAGANPTPAEIKAVEDAHAAVRKAESDVAAAEAALQQDPAAGPGSPVVVPGSGSGGGLSVRQAEMNLASAQSARLAAETAISSARTALTTAESAVVDPQNPTTAENDAIRDAHDAVRKAEQDAAAADEALQRAQEARNEAKDGN